MTKAIVKAQNIISKEGVPTFYTRSLIALEDFVKKTSDAGSVKKMNALNARGFNAMKQKIRKWNKNLESEIEKFKQNPVESEDSAVEEIVKKKEDLESDLDSFPSDDMVRCLSIFED